MCQVISVNVIVTLITITLYTLGGRVLLLQVAAPAAPLQAEAAPAAHLHPGPGPPGYRGGPAGRHSCQVGYITLVIMMVVIMSYCLRVKMFPDGGISRIRIMAKPANLQSEE